MTKESNVNVLPLGHGGNFYWHFFLSNGGGGRGGGREREREIYINTLLFVFKNIISTTN